MKNWIAPAMQELDVKLTAKELFSKEFNIEMPGCEPLVGGYNSTGETVVHNPGSCNSDCKCGTAS